MNRLTVGIIVGAAIEAAVLVAVIVSWSVVLWLIAP